MTSVNCGHSTTHTLPNVVSLLYDMPPWDHAHYIALIGCVGAFLYWTVSGTFWWSPRHVFCGASIFWRWEATLALDCICTAVLPRRGSLCRTLKEPLGKQVGCPVRGLFWWPPAAGSVRRQEKKTLGRSLCLSVLRRQEAG